MPNPFGTGRSTVRQTVIVVAVVLGLVVPLFLFGYAAKAVFLLFGGGLFAVFLRAAADLVQRWAHLSERIALAVVLLAILALSITGAWFFATPISEQVNQLATQLPKSIDSLKDTIKEHPWGQWLIEQAESSKQNGQGTQQAVKTGAQALSLVTEGLGYVIIIFFVGVYFAVNPTLYLNGTLRLFPLSVRPTLQDAIVETVLTLRRWLMGRLIAMAFVGVGTGIGLWLLNIPLAMLLGILAGLLGFIPYVGPIISAVPAILLALELHGMTSALYIVAVYVGVQILQDYILTPLIQQQAVSLPPVLILTAQIFAGLWVGAIAVMFATPFVVVLMVLIRRLYVEEYLGDRGDQRPEPAAHGGNRAVTRSQPG